MTTWNTQLFMNVCTSICRQPETFSQVEEYYDLHLKVKLFEALVWFPHLQAQVNGTNQRGMEGVVVPLGSRAVKVLTWCCAGRCLVQLERGDVSLTLITADTEKPWQREMSHVAPNMGPMGIQSLEGEHWEIMKMLYEVMRYGAEIKLQANAEVTIG